MRRLDGTTERDRLRTRRRERQIIMAYIYEAGMRSRRAMKQLAVIIAALACVAVALVLSIR